MVVVKTQVKQQANLTCHGVGYVAHTFVAVLYNPLPLGLTFRQTLTQYMRCNVFCLSPQGSVVQEPQLRTY